MDRQQGVITRLCALVTRVGAERFKNVEAHDCFCLSMTSETAVSFQMSERILEFIENAVSTAIVREQGQ